MMMGDDYEQNQRDENDFSFLIKFIIYNKF